MKKSILLAIVVVLTVTLAGSAYGQGMFKLAKGPAKAAKAKTNKKGSGTGMFRLKSDGGGRPIKTTSAEKGKTLRYDHGKNLWVVE